MPFVKDEGMVEQAGKPGMGVFRTQNHNSMRVHVILAPLLVQLTVQTMFRAWASTYQMGIATVGQSTCTEVVIISCSGKDTLSKWHFDETLITILVCSRWTAKPIFLIPMGISKQTFHLQATSTVLAVSST
jgi:hypothetical protein